MIEIVTLVSLLRQNILAIIAGTLISGIVGYGLTTSQPPAYRSDAIIAVGSYIVLPNPNASEIQISGLLTQTYIERLQTFSLLQATINAANLDLTPDELAKNVEAETIPNTSLIRIYVNSQDAALSAKLANELANQLILRSPSGLTVEEESLVNLSNAQVERLSLELQTGLESVNSLDARISNEGDPTILERLIQQRDDVLEKINQISVTTAQYSSVITSLRQRTNSLEIVEPARIPEKPQNLSPFIAATLATVFGFGLTCMLIYLRDLLDNRVRSAEDMSNLGAPLLASIDKSHHDRQQSRQGLVILQNPKSSAAEAYYRLRALLRLQSQNTVVHTKIIIITNPIESQSSVVASNLAICVAQSGNRVLLIDSDMRNPSLHKIFDIENQNGFDGLLEKPLDDLSQVAEMVEAFVHSTEVPGLHIMTSAHYDGNPAELLGSAETKQRLERIKNCPYDLILAVTPSCLVYSDSATLALALEDVVVIVQVECDRTDIGSAKAAIDHFEQLNIPIVGTIINRVDNRSYRQRLGFM